MAFTEHGAVMAASVLNTEAAVQASIFVVKAFVQMRAMLSIYKELEERLLELEERTREQFEEHDEKINRIFEILRQFTQTGTPQRKPIGFKRSAED